MIRLNFKCTLLTDVVISAQTATEGAQQSLNFIPGSNFLGILASLIYNDDVEKSYTLFHSGKVRFGDAHIVCLKHRSLQIPFSWYYPKGGKQTTGENYMLNFMSKENFNDLVTNGIQLKQARDGFFTEEGKYLSFEKIFSQKTAYDQEKRRSAESEMFGYEALAGGSQWQFCVDLDDDVLKEDPNVIEKIKILSGKRSLGRSKTAEYGGRATIEFIDDESVKNEKIVPKEIELENRKVQNGQVSYENKKQKIVFLYAESRLAFRDAYGQPTFMPTADQLGMPATANILWDRSQIRTGSFAPWNGKRGSRDEDRVFIEKGSVFVVGMEGIETFSSETINQGVGLYKAEGFGKLLINPGFLNFDPKSGKLNLQLEKGEPDKVVQQTATEKIEQDKALKEWLMQQNNLREVLELVEDFIQGHGSRFNKVTSSQWGEVRSYARSAKNKNNLLHDLFEAPDKNNDILGGYLMHGVALEQWKNGRGILKETLEKEKKPDKVVLQFVEELASVMAKKGGAR